MGVIDEVDSAAPRRLDLQTLAFAAMALGTAVLLAGLCLVMVREPFEHIDDLIWLGKLRHDSIAQLPFAQAWIGTSPFYRPVTVLILKLLNSAFGLSLVPYRLAQFAALLLLLWCSRRVVRQIGLRTETMFLLTVFIIGSPFISGSILWLSDLQQVIVLICFAAGLAALLSDRPSTHRLTLCSLAFAVALLTKETGLALLIFYPFLVREQPVRATAAFGLISVGYFVSRALVLGPAAAASGPDEEVGYLFQFLSRAQKHALFPGSSIYLLYGYDVAVQAIALFLRLTKWGMVIKEVEYETVLQIASTGLIVLGAGAWRKRPVACLLLTGVALGGLLFSYSSARDRHLAVPGYAYGLLLAIAVDALQARWRWIVFCVWAAWAMQAAITVRGVHRASVNLIENVYRPNLTPTDPHVALDVWISARETALRLR